MLMATRDMVAVTGNFDVGERTSERTSPHRTPNHDLGRTMLTVNSHVHGRINLEHTLALSSRWGSTAGSTLVIVAEIDVKVHKKVEQQRRQCFWAAQLIV